MKTTIVSLVLAGFTALVTGCGSADDADESSANAVTASGAQTAVIEKVAIDEAVDAKDTTWSESMTQCTMTGDYIKVSGLPAAAADAINAALVPEAFAELKKSGCDEAFDVNPSSEVLLNEKGILSVQQSEDSYYAGAAHPDASILVRSFDLATGKQLEIADVFSDPTGMQLAHAVIAALESSADEEAKDLVEFVKDLILENPDWMNFALTKDSVRVFLTGYVPHAAFALAAEPVELRYSDLRDALSGASPAVAVWAQAK